MTTLRVFSTLVSYAIFVALPGIAGWCAYKVLSREQLWARNRSALVAPFVFPFVIIAYGLVFWWRGAEDTEPAWRLQAFRCVCLLYPLLCIYSVWQSRGYRWFAAALIPLSFVISLAAAAWAAAAVTGD
jgi:hypothetical protein